MLTVQEFIRDKKTGYLRADIGVKVFHMHALEVAQHVLRADENATRYGKPQAQKEPERHVEGLRIGMELRPSPAEFQKYVDNTARVGRKWSSQIGDNGDIDIDRYINRDQLPFDEAVRVRRDKPARFILLDAGVNWHDREKSYMEERHKKIYAEVLQCEAENTPCKVIAALQCAFPESNYPYRWYLTVKDWTDPIFPGIWGAYSNNRSTNHFTNMIMMFLVGTHTSGNGRTCTFTADDFEGEDILAIPPFTYMTI